MADEKPASGAVSEEGILGTFPSSEETARALEALKQAGLKEVCLYSPVDPGEMGLSVTKLKSPVGRFTLMGVIIGILAGLFLGGGTAVLYPIETGGMPILSLPAVGIITFEMMVLFALLATVAGFIYFAIFSAGRKDFVPQRVSSDRFGIAVRGGQHALQLAADVLKRCGAERVEKQIARLWFGLSMILIIPSLVLGFPWTRDMVDQPARGPQEEAVPLLPSRVPRQGKSVEAGSKAGVPRMENPIPATETSLQLGKKLFEHFCVVCHGSGGKGDGIIAKKIGEFPDFTKKDFRTQPDGCFFAAITDGANFVSEISRPRPTVQEMAHDDHEEGDAHAHGEEEDHGHDEMASTDHEHDDDQEAGHDHEGGGVLIQDKMTAAEHEHDDGHEDEHAHEHEESEHAHEDEGDHAHEDPEHEHGEMASMDHGSEDAHEHEHGEEDEHAHASEEPGCFEDGHGHGEGDDGHAHGSGKKHFMPPYRDSLNPTERWHIVNFLKHGLGRE